MTDSEKLDLLLSEIGGLKVGMENLNNKMTGLEDRMTGLEGRMTALEDRMTRLEDRMAGLEDRMTGLEGRMVCQEEVSQNLKLHLENATDKNITILAENHISLIDKLAQAVPAASKERCYEVKVNFLLDEVSEMKKDIRILKEQHKVSEGALQTPEAV